MQGEGIRGADLVFACIGPALEIFSRYRAVETAEGREVGLPEYLEKVWEVVGRAALQQVLGMSEAQARNGLAGALEEDARLTALFLWTLQSTEASEKNGKKKEAEEKTEEDDEAVAKAAAKGFSLPFDVVRRFAQPMGIDLDRWTDRVIGQKKGVVRLLPVAERAKDLFGKDGARSAAEWIERDPGVRPATVALPRMGRGTQTDQQQKEIHPRQRGRAANDRRHRAGPGTRRHAVAVQRTRQRAEGADHRRAGPRPRLPAPCQRPLRPVPARQPGKTAPRRHAAGSTEIMRVLP